MHYGVIATKTDYADKIIELTQRMVQKGFSVSIFLTDDGVLLIKNPEIAGLRNLAGVEMSLCDYTARSRNIPSEEIPEGVIAGTQYQNSLIHSECDRILFF